MPELAKLVNTGLSKEFTVSQVAEKQKKGAGLKLRVSFVCGNEVTCHVTPNEKETPKFNPVPYVVCFHILLKLHDYIGILAF
jgi:hypothetical protein